MYVFKQILISYCANFDDLHNIIKVCICYSRSTDQNMTNTKKLLFCVFVINWLLQYAYYVNLKFIITSDLFDDSSFHTERISNLMVSNISSTTFQNNCYYQQNTKPDNFNVTPLMVNCRFVLFYVANTEFHTRRIIL